MAFGPAGNTRDLALLVSLVTFGIFFVSVVVVSFIFGLPYYEVLPPELSPGTVSCNEATISEACICDIQFAGTRATYLMHVLVYVWLGSAVVFLTTNVFRMYKDGAAYCNPAIFSLEVSIIVNLCLMFYFVWSFLMYYKYWTAASVIVGLATLLCFASVVIYGINLFAETEFLNHNYPRDLWIHRIFVQNSLGMLAAWFVYLFMSGAAIAMANDAVKDPKASEIVIILLTYCFAAWAPLEAMIWDKLFRYMIAPYCVLIWILAGVFMRLTSNEFNCKDTTVRLYSMVLLIVVIVVTAFRLGFTIYRHCRKPLARNV